MEWRGSRDAVDTLHLLRTCLPWLQPNESGTSLVVPNPEHVRLHVLPWLMQHVAHMPLLRARVLAVDLGMRILHLGWHHSRAGGKLMDFVATCLVSLKGG